ncbi:uncharacterized protein MONBRDRAFT_8455 [Monosiga brevicollis MX1]|uniref:Uncharacterized protein n=1 Tax=Monosiga brevicollis TaxID=81824 RepID=A9V033_MONBE|nr:uncharacterized protein MONBRDRAFT_8455 [Monosiga brevicollis MX1]EDQ88940.1 predicted protein [Monosiga brevicollis MX1]|eukprot:XP_001746045.1 hypothetical protein [Monosiga brevicollis MX1]
MALSLLLKVLSHLDFANAPHQLVATIVATATLRSSQGILWALLDMGLSTHEYANTVDEAMWFPCSLPQALSVLPRWSRYACHAHEAHVQLFRAQASPPSLIPTSLNREKHATRATPASADLDVSRIDLFDATRADHALTRDTAKCYIQPGESEDQDDVLERSMEMALHRVKKADAERVAMEREFQEQYERVHHLQYEHECFVAELDQLSSVKEQLREAVSVAHGERARREEAVVELLALRTRSSERTLKLEASEKQLAEAKNKCEAKDQQCTLTHAVQCGSDRTYARP